jgi:dethiobiotin synthetase
MTDDDNIAVVGTGTGVGKTVVTAGLVGVLREDGVDARAVKPCQTGHPPDDDAAFVATACGTEAAATCLARLEPPLAPAVAAEQAGADLSYQRLRDGCERELAAAETGLVEGIGGLRVPLADGHEVLDLVADLDVSAVVVARSGLGTLNHTTLTVDALRRQNVPVRGIVLNRYEGASTAERTNPAVLERMTDLSVHTLPETDLTDPCAAVDAVADHLPRSLVR